MSRIEMKNAGDSNVTRLKTEKEKQKKVKNSNRIFIVLALLLLVVFFYSIGLFVIVPEDRKNLAYYAEAVGNKLRNLFEYIFTGVSHAEMRENVNRYCCIVLCGASLAVSGAVFQGSFRNILVSPSILGVQSGGTLANTLYVFLFVSLQSSVTSIRFSEIEEMSFFQRNMQQLFVFTGCVLSLVIVLGVANLVGRGRAKTTHIILCGMIFSSLASSAVSLIQYKILVEDTSNERIDVIRRFAMGSFDKVYSYEHLILLSMFLIPGLIFFLILSGKFNVMALGEEQAVSMGLNYKAFKYLVLIVSSFMTAVIISSCGQISFVGFIIPQIARRLVGPDYKKMLPSCMMIGAIMMMLVYDLAILLNQTTAMNLITTTIGSVMMAYAFLTRRGVSRAD